MVLTRVLEVWYNRKFIPNHEIVILLTFASIYSNRDSWYNAFIRQLCRKSWAMDMSYEDYIDEYYESAMTAEKLYDRFIEVALELQKWIDEIDNVVVKECREALSWGIYSKNKKIQKRFNELKNEIESKVNAFIQSSELYVMEDTFQWVILPFDTSLLPYKYNGKFGALIDLMTEYPHGDVLGDVTNVPNFHEYDGQSDMDYYEMCQVFHCGIENCQRFLDGVVQRWVKTIWDIRGESWNMKFTMENERLDYMSGRK